MKTLNRRDFLKYAMGGTAVLLVGSKLGWMLKSPGQVAAASQTINLRITDAMKEMVTHNAVNPARCYFWVYKSVVPDYLPEVPGPIIMATKGDQVGITITNALDEPHAFYIPGIFDSATVGPGGPIQPGETRTGTIDLTNAPSGAHLYYDNLNGPVNRMMGLHGTLIVMPTAAAAGHKFTPYDSPTLAVQKLFDDFGPTAHFPGLAWEEGDSTPWALDPAMPNTTPFRQYVWLTHQASPKLFAEVGDYTAGQDYPAEEFMEKFLRGPFKVNNSRVSTDPAYTPQFFTINGQSGMFAHFSPYLTPIGRVGEPVVVHILNAGLWTHSMHLHANHMYITSVNGEVQENPIWVDVYNIHPMDRVDYTVPVTRPPDVPNARGIGFPDTPLTTINGHPVWPPVEEMNVYMPPKGTKAKAADGVTDVELGQRMSPLCFPMHDHSEPSQTAQGGNYNNGLIAGIYYTGDRNTPGHFDFPMEEDFLMAYQNIRGCIETERAAPPLGEEHH
ncbi:MAG: multicopper oxidase domain-containing protein [Chloroflexi bacterium]|nr:multicopper oxidase domain-containing protein [Chloroflexota bacterium]